MNPEYDIRSDVWSFGISMIELATGKFPYSTWKTPFEQLKQVVNEAPPKLPEGEFSEEFDNFIIQWYVPIIQRNVVKPKLKCVNFL